MVAGRTLRRSARPTPGGGDVLYRIPGGGGVKMDAALVGVSLRTQCSDAGAADDVVGAGDQCTHGTHYRVGSGFAGVALQE